MFRTFATASKRIPKAFHPISRVEKICNGKWHVMDTLKDRPLKQGDQIEIKWPDGHLSNHHVLVNENYIELFDATISKAYINKEYYKGLGDKIYFAEMNNALARFSDDI